MTVLSQFRYVHWYWSDLHVFACTVNAVFLITRVSCLWIGKQPKVGHLGRWGDDIYPVIVCSSQWIGGQLTVLSHRNRFGHDAHSVVCYRDQACLGGDS